jgi:hypothetical protein
MRSSGDGIAWNHRMVIEVVCDQVSAASVELSSINSLAKINDGCSNRKRPGPGFRFASEHVAQLVESLMRVAPPRKAAAPACRCLDWSERRDHLGGALGAAFAEHCKGAAWIERQKHSRVVRVTALGSEAFSRLGLKLG